MSQFSPQTQLLQSALKKYEVVTGSKSRDALLSLEVWQHQRVVAIWLVVKNKNVSPQNQNLSQGALYCNNVNI